MRAVGLPRVLSVCNTPGRRVGPLTTDEGSILTASAGGAHGRTAAQTVPDPRACVTSAVMRIGRWSLSP